MSLISLGSAVRSVRSFEEVLSESIKPTLIQNGEDQTVGVEFSVNPDPSSPRGATRVALDIQGLNDVQRAMREFDPNKVRDTYTIVSSSIRLEYIPDSDEEDAVERPYVTFSYSDAKHSRKVVVPADKWSGFLGFLGDLESELASKADSLAKALAKIQAEEDARVAARNARRAERDAKKGVKIG